MLLAIDIGASKTLLAVFENNKLVKKQLFKTPPSYQDFLLELDKNISAIIAGSVVTAAGVAVPGAIKEASEVIITNLKWGEVSIKEHLKRNLKIPVVIENDANLAGLYEARHGNGNGYQTVLYVTLSTGVGTAVIKDGEILLPKSEGGQAIANYNTSSFKTVEDVISGPDFKKRYGKAGFETTDQTVWNSYSRDLAAALYSMITLLGPDIAVLGGGMANHFNYFKEPLLMNLREFNTGLYPLPKIAQAKNTNEAVIYGCSIAAQEANK